VKKLFDKLVVWRDKALARCGLMWLDVHEKQLSHLRSEHERHKESLRMQIECAHKDGLDYITANSKLRIQEHKGHHCSCKRYGFTIYMDESMMWGLRPGDRQQAEWFRYMLSYHIAEMIERGMFTREEV